MGHKVHPYGFRLGVSRTWTAKWFADDKEYTASLQEDIKIRSLIAKRLANASVSGVEIERGINHVTVTIHTAKPGIVIGKGGANVEVLRQQIGALTTRKVKLEIKEIRQPELDAYLVALNIAQQLTRRVAYKNALALIAEQAYIVPLYSLPVYYAHTKDLDFRPYPDELPRFWEARWKQRSD